MDAIQFKPVSVKKDAQRMLTSVLVMCRDCRKQFVSITKLNTCFGLKSKGGEMARKAISALGIKTLAKGRTCFITKDDARKVIDFVYSHKASK